MATKPKPPCTMLTKKINDIAEVFMLEYAVHTLYPESYKVITDRVRKSIDSDEMMKFISTSFKITESSTSEERYNNIISTLESNVSHKPDQTNNPQERIAQLLKELCEKNVIDILTLYHSLIKTSYAPPKKPNSTHSNSTHSNEVHSTLVIPNNTKAPPVNKKPLSLYNTYKAPNPLRRGGTRKHKKRSKKTRRRRAH